VDRSLIAHLPGPVIAPAFRLIYQAQVWNRGADCRNPSHQPDYVYRHSAIQIVVIAYLAENIAPPTLDRVIDHRSAGVIIPG
jgi:hypothetical protein